MQTLRRTFFALCLLGPLALLPSTTQAAPPLSTSILVVSTHNPSTFGQTVVFSVLVAPPAGSLLIPSGSCQLMDGATSLGLNVLTSAGTCVFSSNSLAVGPHTITLVYSGDATFAANTGSLNTNPQVVNGPAGTPAPSSGALLLLGILLTALATLVLRRRPGVETR